LIQPAFLGSFTALMAKLLKKFLIPPGAQASDRDFGCRKPGNPPLSGYGVTDHLLGMTGISYQHKASLNTIITSLAEKSGNVGAIADVNDHN
jgi:hypothetical protein